MPYDSNKVTFNDKMEIFYNNREFKKPEEIAKKQSMKPKNIEQVETNHQPEFLNQVAEKKKEQMERRRNMLFLKRLEEDGMRLKLARKDRHLLKDFEKSEDEEPLDKLDKIM